MSESTRRPENLLQLHFRGSTENGKKRSDILFQWLLDPFLSQSLFFSGTHSHARSLFCFFPLLKSNYFIIFHYNLTLSLSLYLSHTHTHSHFVFVSHDYLSQIKLSFPITFPYHHTLSLSRSPSHASLQHSNSFFHSPTTSHSFLS